MADLAASVTGFCCGAAPHNPAMVSSQAAQNHGRKGDDLSTALALRRLGLGRRQFLGQEQLSGVDLEPQQRAWERPRRHAGQWRTPVLFLDQTTVSRLHYGRAELACPYSMLDRLTHHVHIREISGDSFRLKPGLPSWVPGRLEYTTDRRWMNC